jgi:8-oxo-dGTP pyrophosphatase MutT (NUDIX family)
MWLPPGGHIESNEDPHQAALREACEEAGFPVAILPTVSPYEYHVPPQLPAPATIMVEEIPANKTDPAHQHIDMIYFARPLSLETPSPPADTWRWVSEKTLRENQPLVPSPGLASVPIPNDVRILGLAAIKHATKEAT